MIVNGHFECASHMSQSYSCSYKLPHYTPMFMADGRTCDWFFVFENALNTLCIPDDMILPLLSNLVKDTALQLLKTYMRDHGSDSNWDDLRNTFQSVDLYNRNRVKLTNLKQGSDSLDTYNKNFDDLLSHYTNGLSDKVKYEWMQLLQSQHNMNICMLTHDQSYIKDLLQVVDVLILILLHPISLLVHIVINAVIILVTVFLDKSY